MQTWQTWRKQQLIFAIALRSYFKKNIVNKLFKNLAKLQILERLQHIKIQFETKQAD
jgi:mannitol/fructose-specific phosphotransferase system IIA component